MQFLPLYFDLRRGRIALIGGKAAESKLRLLALGRRERALVCSSDRCGE